LGGGVIAEPRETLAKVSISLRFHQTIPGNLVAQAFQPVRINSYRYAFTTYCCTMRWVLKKAPLMAMAPYMARIKACRSR
jgi:hypothetical protein